MATTPAEREHADLQQLETVPPERARTDGRALGSGYLLEAEIGGGATGRVWRGRRRFDGAPVAVKLLRAEFSRDSDAVVRFLGQRTVLSAVRHPHLVSVHDLVAEGEDIAVVMDLVEGEELRRLISHQALDQPAALAVLGQVAAALAAVHAAGVVHRDIKPEIVLVRWLDGQPQALLTDFGLAKMLDSPVWTQTSQLAGTPAYVAPEMVAGRRAGPASDVYALAVMGYELLVGERPFRAPDIAALLRAHLESPPPRPPGLSDPVWLLLEAALAKDPAQRPTAEEFATRLAADAATTVVLAPVRRGDAPGAPAGRGDPARLETADAARPAPPAPAPPVGRRRRWPIWVAAALCAVLAGGAGVWFGRPGAKTTHTPPAQPAPVPYFLPVTAISPRAGTVRLDFPDASRQEGFAFYVVYRNNETIDSVHPGPEVPPYLVNTDDHQTRHCYRVAALLFVDQAPATLAAAPACRAADGKLEE